MLKRNLYRFVFRLTIIIIDHHRYSIIIQVSLLRLLYKWCLRGFRLSRFSNRFLMLSLAFPGKKGLNFQFFILNMKVIISK